LGNVVDELEGKIVRVIAVQSDLTEVIEIVVAAFGLLA